jgi:hypothetical protein
METYIPFTDDDFLTDLKADFYGSLLGVYKNLGSVEDVKAEITEMFKTPDVRISDIGFVYEPLALGTDESEDALLAAENIRRVHRSLGLLTPSQAAMEKVWVALLNTHYLDYHLHVIRQLQGREGADQLIYDRTFLKGPIHTEKRRQMMNNLAVLWWIGHYTYDKDNASDPFHLTDFFVSTPYRGNAIAFFSSNIHGNRNITLGILDGIKYLVDNGTITVNRYAYTNSSKIINIIAGVKLVDVMSREDIKRIIIKELPHTENMNII